jgi:hypothetical protein
VRAPPQPNPFVALPTDSWASPPARCMLDRRCGCSSFCKPSPLPSWSRRSNAFTAGHYTPYYSAVSRLPITPHAQGRETSFIPQRSPPRDWRACTCCAGIEGIDAGGGCPHRWHRLQALAAPGTGRGEPNREDPGEVGRGVGLFLLGLAAHEVRDARALDCAGAGRKRSRPYAGPVR